LRQDADPTVISQIPPTDLHGKERPHRIPVLVATGGVLEGLKFIIGKSETTLGRDLSADILLEDSHASRLHCRIVYANFGMTGVIPDCRLYDSGSTNGTLVNGEKTESMGAWLSDRDRIAVGQNRFAFFIWDEEELRLSLEDQSKATRDDETRLYNLSCFLQVLKREFAVARGRQDPLSLALIHIDPSRSEFEKVGESLSRARKDGQFLARVDDRLFGLTLPGIERGQSEEVRANLASIIDPLGGEVSIHALEAETESARLFLKRAVQGS
jgi:pSer/pThr/pTyr-binding forkhead associated (FHA) protein